MEEAVLPFGMEVMLVVDTDIQFRGASEAICKYLQITLWTLAHGNHKVNIVEKYHRLFNKTQDISGKDRGSHDIFIKIIKTSHYAWNSAPIDDTNVMRKIAAFGR